MLGPVSRGRWSATGHLPPHLPCQGGGLSRLLVRLIDAHILFSRRPSVADFGETLQAKEQGDGAELSFRSVSLPTRSEQLFNHPALTVPIDTTQRVFKPFGPVRGQQSPVNRRFVADRAVGQLVGLSKTQRGLLRGRFVRTGRRPFDRDFPKADRKSRLMGASLAGARRCVEVISTPHGLGINPRIKGAARCHHPGACSGMGDQNLRRHVVIGQPATESNFAPADVSRRFIRRPYAGAVHPCFFKRTSPKSPASYPSSPLNPCPDSISPRFLSPITNDEQDVCMD